MSVLHRGRANKRRLQKWAQTVCAGLFIFSNPTATKVLSASLHPWFITLVHVYSGCTCTVLQEKFLFLQKKSILSQENPGKVRGVWRSGTSQEEQSYPAHLFLSGGEKWEGNCCDTRGIAFPRVSFFSAMFIYHLNKTVKAWSRHWWNTTFLQLRRSQLAVFKYNSN